LLTVNLTKKNEVVVLVLLQSPRLHDQAVVHDGLLGEAGGLQQDQPGSLNKVKRGGAAGPALLLAHGTDWVALSGKWSSAGVI
jgi:hypothetical protein